MTSESASLKKIAGHVNEYDFAQIIGGEVNLGSQTDKKDVIDKQHRFHSVKGGKWWQIFLYRRNRLQSNTILQGIGDLAPLMIQCLDSFPEHFQDYEQDKIAAKIRLQEPMRRLCAELQKPSILPAFFNKAMFNGGEVNYLSVLPSDIPNTEPIESKRFHIFTQIDVVSALSERLEIANSKARNRSQMDAQKVILRHNGVNVGEIEVRTDSRIHYKEMKFRLSAVKILALLIESMDAKQEVSEQTIAYGNAIRTFHI